MDNRTYTIHHDDKKRYRVWTMFIEHIMVWTYKIHDTIKIKSENTVKVTKMYIPGSLTVDTGVD